MSKPFKAFREFITESNQYKKLFKLHNPGQRVVPSKSWKNDEEHQYRVDAGETIDGRKNLYLQINSQATSPVLKEYVRKNGTHAKVATVPIEVNTPVEKQKEAADKVMDMMAKELRSKLR